MMNLLKKLAACGLSLTMILSLAACGGTDDTSSGESGGEPVKYLIGISQYGQHGSLDNCREGFLQGLEEAGLVEGTDYTIDYQNASFDDNMAIQIAQAFSAEDAALMVGIATNSAIACFNAAEDKDIPVIFTAITDPEEAVIKHFVDSLTLLKALEIKKNAKVIDVGTGAGFPGIPLKIMRPDIELTLLDSLNKRLVFLREVCDAIGIEAETIHKRAEEAGKDTKLRESFDVATARAVANMNILAEYCIPLIKMKGYFAAMKGPSLPDELEYARKAISSLGCDVVKTVPFILPDEEQSERFVAVMRKLRFTPKMYPRHGGTITKKPLFLEQKGEAK